MTMWSNRKSLRDLGWRPGQEAGPIRCFPVEISRC